ncbi:hypothetical protein DV738_g2677, partial [Chaetothyriales sp. CBS 135597]
MQRRRGYLPREGIHLGFLLSSFESCILSAPMIVLGLACLCVRLVPHAVPSTALARLPSQRSTLIYLGLAVFARVQKACSRAAINNWVSPKPPDLAQEIFVVTGGTTGIGRSCVDLILSRSPKARVAIIDIVQPETSLGEAVRFYKCDLSDREQTELVAKQIKEELGDPTVLINNAGLSRGKYMSEIDWQNITATLGVNLIAPFLLIRAFLPAMIARNHGHIVNIASLSAYAPPAGLADYAASKAGMLAMTESLRLELRHVHKATSVRVSAFVLSFVKTPLFKGETNQPNFLSPLLDVDTVGEEIFGAIEQGASVVRYMPAISGIVASIWAYPRWFQDVILNGTAKLRVDYRGRQHIDEHGRVSG